MLMVRLGPTCTVQCVLASNCLSPFGKERFQLGKVHAFNPSIQEAKVVDTRSQPRVYSETVSINK